MSETKVLAGKTSEALAAMTAERDRLKADIDQIRILQRMRPAPVGGAGEEEIGQ